MSKSLRKLEPTNFIFNSGQFDIAKPTVFNFIHFTDLGESGSCFMGDHVFWFSL